MSNNLRNGHREGSIGGSDSRQTPRTELEILPGERLYPRSPETVRAYNERVGLEVLTWHQFRIGINPGTMTRSGDRVRIPTRRYGRRLFVSLEGIDRWARAAADPSRGESPRKAETRRTRRPARATKHESGTRITAAEKYLAQEGL